MSIEAMKQALEALEELNKVSIGVDAVCLPGEIDTAMDALRTAIEQAEKQEPVAWMDVGDKGECYSLRWWSEPENRHEVPLYTTPPAAQRQPLTERELQGYFLRTNTAEPLAEGWPGLERFARAIEAAHGITGVKK